MLSIRGRQFQGVLLLVSSSLYPFTAQHVQDAQPRQSQPVVQRVEHSLEDKPKRSVRHH
jgi:hypothetical protein